MEQFDIKKFLKKGLIENEVDLERVLDADKKLRILSKKHSKYIAIRKKLRDCIEKYEQEHWESKNIDSLQIEESDHAEILVERERNFYKCRRELIRKRLKKANIKQQDLGLILGHASKSYISELVNGVSPFSMRDLVVINKLLKIDFKYLISPFLSIPEQVRIEETIKMIPNINLGLSDDFYFNHDHV